MPAPGTRAAKAAERVAARYANAPSYSEMLAREARAAVDAAKAAAKAAQEAQAAFQYVLEGLEIAAPAEPQWGTVAQPEHTAEYLEASAAAISPYAPEMLRDDLDPAIGEQTDKERADAVCWEASARQDEPAAYDVVRRGELPGAAVADSGAPEEIVKPIYANLIEFPRPMVATRRARPRLAEGPLAAADDAPQLSIFEVDPAAISLAPSTTAVDPSAPPSWMRTEWPALAEEQVLPAGESGAMPPALTAEVSAPPMNSGAMASSMCFTAQGAAVAQPWEELYPDFTLEDEAALRPAATRLIAPAPLSRRMLAVVVDCALTAAVLVIAAFLAAPRVSTLPGLHVVELGAALAFVAAGFAYHAFCFALFRATAGMRYAGIEIDTFSGSAPTRRRRSGRLTAMLLSVLPLGLGFLWSLFDDDNLAWHDRLSGTYLRKR